MLNNATLGMHIVLLICLPLTYSPPAQDAAQYTAVVGKSEASLSLPVQQRDRWSWNQPGASPKSGSLSDLISAGQRSLFERSQSRLMTIVRGADVKVKLKGDHLVITVYGEKDLQRLFSSRPTSVIFKIAYPDEAEISQKVPIVYQ
jgi:hypothetical protein